MSRLRFATLDMTRLSLFVFSWLLFSCATSGKIKVDTPDVPPATAAPENKDELTLVFAGDVMAHKPNYAGGNFDKIWEDIKDFVSDSDLAFANIEAPVNDDIEWKTYPQFNMHGEYVEAAIKAGFNVFSLTNNHTNDQLLEGVKGTKKYFENLEKKSEGSERRIYACGLKDKASGPLTYRIIEKNGFKILFVSITELLNAPVAKENIDYYPTSEENHKFLIAEMKRLRKENACNFSIISIHTDEPEYIREVTKEHEKFFKELVTSGEVDIVWANHPHIVKRYETLKRSPEQAPNALIMYAMGNTISAQRTNPQWEKPETDRDNTGDGIILKVKAKGMVGAQSASEERRPTVGAPEQPGPPSGGIRPTLEISEPYIITTYIDPNGLYVIRHLDENFIKCFRRLNYKKKADYFEKRLEITKNATK